MKNFKMVLSALAVLCLSTAAFAVQPTLILKNQYGEQSNNTVIGGTCSLPASATHTILSNLTGGTATAIANTYAAVSAVLTPAMLLTGFSSGAGTVAGTDTVLQAINKLSGDLQNKAIKIFTSSASAGGSASEVFVVTGLASTDTILSVTQSVKGANSLPLLGYNTVATNAITGVYSADPGASAVIKVLVLR